PVTWPILVVADDNLIEGSQCFAEQDRPGDATAQEGRLAQSIRGEGDMAPPQSADNAAAAGVLHLHDHARPSCRKRMVVSSPGKATWSPTSASSALSKSARPCTCTCSWSNPAATFACRSSFRPRAPRKSITSRFTCRLGHRSYSPLRKKPCTRSSG